LNSGHVLGLQADIAHAFRHVGEAFRALSAFQAMSTSGKGGFAVVHRGEYRQCETSLADRVGSIYRSAPRH
jgi:hypothetical protein